MKKQRLKIIALTALIATAISSTACGLQPIIELKAQPTPSSDGIDREFLNSNAVSEEFSNALTDFNEKTSALLYNNDGNVNYSPISLYLALSLAKLGGADDAGLVELLGIDSFAGVSRTYEKYGETVVIDVPTDENEALADQCQRLMHLTNLDGENTEISIANSIWSSVGIKADFARLAAERLYAECFESLDGSEMSKWIKKQTKGLLAPELEEDEEHNCEEHMISILNTVYFNAQWTDKFQKSRNEKGIFHAPSGDVSAEFMQRNDNGGFRRGEDYTTASLGLKDGGSMTIVLPDEGVDIRELLKERGLTELLEGGEGKSGNINWYFPKFDFDCKMSFKELLTELGVGGIFEYDSGMAKNITDFTPMTVSDIRQETTISVDEKGVSAAAYTEIIYCGAAMPVDTADMRMDRPFLYTVEYKGAVLFAGIVDNPNG